MSGKTDQIKGHVKEAAGDITGDEELQAEGKADRLAGSIKEKAGDVVDAVKDKIHDVTDKH